MYSATYGGQERDLSSVVVRVCTKCGAQNQRKATPWCNVCSSRAQQEFRKRCIAEGLCSECACVKEPQRAKLTLCEACHVKRSIRQAEKQQRGKQLLVEAAGGKCVDCGLVTEWLAAYDFHHLDPSTKDINLSNYAMRSLKDALKEIKKCVLLCSTCHRIRHAKEHHQEKLYMSMLWKHREAREKTEQVESEPVGPSHADLEAKLKRDLKKVEDSIGEGVGEALDRR